MQTVPDLISRWPSIAQFAADIGEPSGVVQQWKRRKSIPSRCWPQIVRAAKSRKISGVTLEGLASIQPPRKLKREGAAA